MQLISGVQPNTKKYKNTNLKANHNAYTSKYD